MPRAPRTDKPAKPAPHAKPMGARGQAIGGYGAEEYKPEPRAPLAKPTPQKPTPNAVRWWNRKSDGASVAVIEDHDSPAGFQLNMMGVGITHRDTLEEATERVASYLATLGPISAFSQHGT